MYNTICFVLAGLFTMILGEQIPNGTWAEWAKVGKSGSLSCPLDSTGTLELCRWLRIDKGGEVVYNVSFIPKPKGAALYEFSPHDNYSYVGNMINECGIWIKNVTEGDMTIWECQTTETRNKTVVQSKKIQLLKTVRPTNPNILDKKILENLVIPGNNGTGPMTLRCCAGNGAPPPELSFFLGRNIIPGLKSDVSTTTPEMYCVKWGNATFSRKENGAKVRCTLNHQTYDEEVSDLQILNLFYKPQFVGNEPSHHQFAVSSNPSPKINAFINGTNKSVSEAFEFCNKISEYNISTWNYIWKFDFKKVSVPMDQNTVIIAIVASNMYGESSIELTQEDLNPILTISDTSRLAEDNLVNIIIIACPILVITSGVLMLIIAKWKNLLCFRYRRADHALSGF